MISLRDIIQSKNCQLWHHYPVYDLSLWHHYPVYYLSLWHHYPVYVWISSVTCPNTCRIVISTCLCSIIVIQSMTCLCSIVIQSISQHVIQSCLWIIIRSIFGLCGIIINIQCLVCWFREALSSQCLVFVTMDASTVWKPSHPDTGHNCADRTSRKHLIQQTEIKDNVLKNIEI